jgi:drug/metabolite transporter (DMT)-like permease
VALVLAGFAANSLLCRAALGAGLADAATFSFVRMATGAAALALFAWRAGQGPTLRPRPWASLALATYVLGFSFAYRALTAGTGALLLFGAVQVSMLAMAFLRGDVFPVRKMLGALLAFAGLLVLTVPRLGRPPVGAALSMALAGAAWGVYSLLGAGSARPVGDTQVAFLGATVLVLPALFFAAPHHMDGRGLLLATLSGTLASGATYSLWYAVLPRLGAVRAAVVQLAVPLLTAAAAGLLLGEVPGLGWYLAAALTLSGIALTVRR